MIKILILHAGVSNKGSQALVLSLTNTLKEYIPSAKFSFMGTDVNQSQIPIKKQLAFKPLKNPYPWIYLFKCSIFSISRKLGIHYSISPRSKLFDYYEADVVVNTGGDHLSGEKFGLSSLLNISYGILLGKPVVLYAESLGYYQNSLYRYIANQVLNHTTLITVREKLSKKYLDENKIVKPKVYLTADSAFCLEAVSKANVLDIFQTEGIDINKKPLIGINASGSISKYRKSESNSESYDEIITIYQRVIDDIIDELNASVVLIPHVYTQSVDDTKVITEIYNKVQNKADVKLITTEYNAKELKGIIGMCDLFVGARMHSTIAATSMCVPTVGIAYSHKIHGVIGQMLKQQDYIIDVEDLTYDKLKCLIYECWDNHDIIKNELKDIIPSIEQKSSLNGKYVKDLLDSLDYP
jgi:polysaccharide pyruvyl transferase WcaK-like protein